ncbi:hypothetical protein PMKS-002545 [Pichia membranifaciens]|uniref:Uncharacterized protein n=1 Tax=Pichia membranifaciens TaxID=4926 RepID=A0A1Q2YHN9_9ASCO|nr:hypothetical protein PMKS-002545 [Pichia membranifaciens]
MPVSFVLLAKDIRYESKKADTVVRFRLPPVPAQDAKAAAGSHLQTRIPAARAAHLLLPQSDETEVDVLCEDSAVPPQEPRADARSHHENVQHQVLSLLLHIRAGVDLCVPAARHAIELEHVNGVAFHPETDCVSGFLQQFFCGTLCVVVLLSHHRPHTESPHGGDAEAGPSWGV